MENDNITTVIMLKFNQIKVTFGNCDCHRNRAAQY